MLRGLLTAKCPPRKHWEAEAGTGLHLMGARDRCKHKRAGCHYFVLLCALIDVNRWNVTAGSGGDCKWYLWIMGSEACSVSPAVRKRCLRTLSGQWRVCFQYKTSAADHCWPFITHSILRCLHPLQFIWATERSWSVQVAFAVTAYPIHHNTHSVTLSLTCPANISCWSSVVQFRVFDIKSCAFCGCISLGGVSRYESILWQVVQNSYSTSRQTQHTLISY